MLISSEMRCIGTPLHLKQKFSGGFVLSVQVEKKEKVDAVDEFVRATFANVRLEESFGTYLVYEMPQVNLSKAFDGKFFFCICLVCFKIYNIYNKTYYYI